MKILERMGHWCRHNNLLITATVFYEIALFARRSGLIKSVGGKPSIFPPHAPIGTEHDAYSFLGSRMNPRRLWIVLKYTFPTPIAGWGEKPCSLDDEYCLYRDDHK